MMKSRRTRKREVARSTAAWFAGIAVAIGAAAVLSGAMPTVRRYLRMRAM